MQNNISRTETDILKGVAIIMMLWLHLFLKERDLCKTFIYREIPI